ncbi:lytic murein transglycosylase B [uncultured Oxalicibacterium sp.]|uniref:lytic murein transglycosylase B n=1 Tax=uncultured Oxalicibacterium sp. TaxID=1168540 RepID=UPI0025F8A07C|nr:lytic murein transglycosylase B [uncultured Oxalicibacterium sp.]
MIFSPLVRPVLTAFSLLSLLTLASCASTTEAGKQDKPSATPEKTAVSNVPVTTSKTVTPVQGDEFANFTQWREVDGFIDDMVKKHGFDRKALQETMNKVHYVDRAIQLMKPAPPGKPKNWAAYRARFVEPVRIKGGVAFWNKYASDLQRAEKQYGVPAEIIVAIIGVETVYGRYTGNFRVMDAITTLAFSYPDTPNRVARMAYFRGELENTLLFARDEKIDPFTLLGSYAGAIGWPQFMPGSIRNYAVDFDGDGHINLRNSPVDAIGSVAHFLVEHGWKRGEPVAFPARVDNKRDDWQRFLNQGLEAKYSLTELQAAGITPSAGTPRDMPFGLVDLQNGDGPTEYWLGAANFFAITQYNRSFFYAMSVNELSRVLRTERNF